MTNIAIITARGGSKRIPKKNIQSFCGKPIIAYSIEAALGSKLFNEVMVSTDSEEIAEVAKHYGASVPFMRSEANSNDYATTADVLREVLTEYEKLGKTFDYMCCLYPTAPFITAEKLRTAFNHMKEAEADALTPVVAFSYPPQRAFIIRDGFLQYTHPEFIKTRSQDLEKIYHDCGQFYFYKVSSFLSNLGIKTVPLIIPEAEVQDIDTLSDWKIAEIKYSLMTPPQLLIFSILLINTLRVNTRRRMHNVY